MIDRRAWHETVESVFRGVTQDHHSSVVRTGPGHLSPFPLSSWEEERGINCLGLLPGVARYRAYPRLCCETPLGFSRRRALCARIGWCALRGEGDAVRAHPSCI